MATAEQQRRNLEVRVHLLAAMLEAVDDRDVVLRIVAGAADRDEARAALVGRFGWDDVQVRGVLDLQVQAFTQQRREQLVSHLQEAREALA